MAHLLYIQTDGACQNYYAQYKSDSRFKLFCLYINIKLLYNIMTIYCYVKKFGFQLLKKVDIPLIVGTTNPSVIQITYKVENSRLCFTE